MQHIHHIISFEFLVGVAVGKILLGALLASSIFRNVALAAGASTVCFLYFQKGVVGLLDAGHILVADFSARPSFAQGVALGVVLGFLVFGAYFRRRLS
jgi:hypothetical protein